MEKNGKKLTHSVILVSVPYYMYPYCILYCTFMLWSLWFWINYYYIHQTPSYLTNNEQITTVCQHGHHLGMCQGSLVDQCWLKSWYFCLFPHLDHSTKVVHQILIWIKIFSNSNILVALTPQQGYQMWGAGWGGLSPIRPLSPPMEACPNHEENP